MTGHLLDTNTLIALFHPGRRQTVAARLRSQPRGSVVTSAIVAHELYFGAANSARPEANRRRLNLLFKDIVPLDLGRGDAEAAGEVRASLRARGTPIGPYDLLIAGQGLARGLTVATSNLREFRRVAGLACVDWCAG